MYGCIFHQIVIPDTSDVTYFRYRALSFLIPHSSFLVLRNPPSPLPSRSTCREAPCWYSPLHSPPLSSVLFLFLFPSPFLHVLTVVMHRSAAVSGTLAPSQAFARLNLARYSPSVPLRLPHSFYKTPHIPPNFVDSIIAALVGISGTLAAVF